MTTYSKRRRVAPDPEPVHLPDVEKLGYVRIALLLIPAVSVGMLLIALYQLNILGGGILGIAKLILVGVGAYLVSHFTLRQSVEKGATLATVGYRWAAGLAFFTVTLVGLAFFSATSPGLTIGPTEEARLQSYINEVVAYVDARALAGGESVGGVPVANSIADDFEGKAQCEIASACVSGHGSGYGPTARTLDTLSARARSIADEASTGLTSRAASTEALSAHLAEMEALLADQSRSIWQRRTTLRRMDGGLGTLLNQVDTASPVAILGAYALELRGGAEVPGNTLVSATISGFMLGYARSLESSLTAKGDARIARPVFPDRTGAMDTFSHAGDHIPVLLLAALIDLIFPLTLLGYSLLALDWAHYRQNPNPRRGKRERDDFDDLTEFRPVDPPKNGKPRRGQRKGESQ